MMYETVLFDFDGTLSPTLDYWFNSFRCALTKLGIQATDEEIFAKCFYKNDDQIAAAFSLDSATMFWRHTADELKIQLSAPELFAGVDEVLALCEARRVPVGLVTSGERGVVEPALHKLGVHHHFQVTVTADDITNFKPHPEPVLKALKALGANPAKTLFVGDHLVDIAAGKAAGTDTAIYFTNGHSRFHKLDELQAAAPTMIFSDYHDLLARLAADS
jgi:pyrophosphatase PpaX